MAVPPFNRAIIRVGTDAGLAPAQPVVLFDSTEIALEDDPTAIVLGRSGESFVGATRVRRVAGPVTFPATEGSSGVSQTQEAGAGADNGTPMTIQAQAAQNQTGGNANNDGGSLSLVGGDPGTGGSGAAGGRGAIIIQGGDVSITADYPAGGAASGQIHLQAPTVSLDVHDGTGVHAIIVMDTDGVRIAYATGSKLAFHNATPVVQATRAGQLTDSTGGSVSSTLAAGITDTAAKNAIASLAAKVNALEVVLHNLGLTT